jgi:NitT/TauT family transport system substrate-binding protein
MAVTLIENFRAAFYAPFYAASALGAFKSEGVDVNVKASADAAQTMQTLLAGVGEVAWGGPLRLMLALEKNPARRPIVFCEVVGRDPFFLLGREPNPGFRFQDLQGKRVAVVTEVPTPWMCLQHDLRSAGIDPRMITLTPERTMSENMLALKAGDADVIQVFQPYAAELTQGGGAYLWYAAATRGPTSYTTLNTTRDYAQRHPETLAAMCRAMYRTQKWIAAHDGRALAQAISSYFPHVPAETLATCYEHYRELGVWNSAPLMSRDGFEWLREAGLASGRLRQRFEYDECADMQFAHQAIRENPPALGAAAP